MGLSLLLVSVGFSHIVGSRDVGIVSAVVVVIVVGGGVFLLALSASLCFSRVSAVRALPSGSVQVHE